MSKHDNDYVLMARGTYQPIKIVTNEKNEKVIATKSENDTIERLLQRISLLEENINKQTTQKPQKTQLETNTTITNANQNQDQTNVFAERRKRTRIPQFSNGNTEQAQQWLERYEVISEYLGFSETDMAEEMAAVLDGQALHWYIGLAKADKRDWTTLRQQFLQQHGGGINPAMSALAELKELRQGNKNMRTFGPIIVDLLHRAQIFQADVQLDYFKDRIHPELLKAIIYRGPKTLMEAINITTEVEQALLKAVGKSTDSSLGSVYTPTSGQQTTSITYGNNNNGSNSATKEQQNYQYQKNNFKQQKSRYNNDRKQRKENRKCYNCNKQGHIAKDCRLPRKQQTNKTNNQQIKTTNDDMEENIFAHLMQQNNQEEITSTKMRFSSNVTVTEDIQQKCLIDTGSTISSIKATTARRLNLYEFNIQPREILYGNKSTQITTKKAIFKFEINSIPSTAYLHVVERQNEDIILGMDWMISEDIILQPKTKMISKRVEQQNPQEIGSTNEDKLVQDILKDYPKIMPKDDDIQTVTNAPYKHRIITGDSLPVHVRDYRRPYAENEQIKKEVEDMLKKKVIEPSTSEWCSPVVMIKKPDGTWRFCVDYRKLNAVTQKDKFPIGNLHDLLDTLNGCKYLSTIDLKSGYWQIPMDPRDAHKTAFIANGALYQFKVLPFGCVTGPNSFSRFMHGVLQNLPHVMVYLDDVICFSKSIEEHERDLRNLLQRLSDFNIKISLKKSKFFKTEVKYLGFIVSSEGIRSDPEKTKAIKDWKSPTTVNALQRFLGFCAFYRRFLKNLAQVAAPMYTLLRKDTPFNWTEEINASFIKLKHMVMTLPTLAYPDPHKPYDVHTDASMHGLGAVIVQDGRPVAFASRTLTNAEKNYSTTEQEALCVVYALEYFYPYLYGASITIYTDHAALKSILSTKEPRGRIARWILAIQAFTFTIVHRKGSANTDADALSRREQINNQNLTNSTLSKGEDEIPEVELSIENFKKFQKEDTRIQAILKQDVKLPFLWQHNILFYQYDDNKQVPVLPARMVKTVLKHVHDAPTGGHFGIDKTLEKAKLLAWWFSMKDDIKLWIQHCEKCQRYKIRTDSGVAPMKPILPSKLGEIWAADIAILPLSKKGNRYLLVIMEYLSKWVVTAALPSFDSDHVAQVLLFEVVLKIGLPERLITDNGANFISDAMKSVCQRLGIKRSLTSVESPQTDGLVERMNRTLKVSLAMAVDNEPQLWDEYLQFVTFAYNTAKQASSGYSPFNVLYGREVILPLNNELRINPKTYETETWVNYLNKYIPILHGKAITNIKRAQEAQKKFYDKGTRIKRDYKVGDLIARKNLEKSQFPKERWTGPWVITKANNTDGTSWKIIKKDDPYPYETTANIRHMRPWFPQDQQEDKLIQSSMKIKWTDHLLRGKQCKDLKVRPNQMMASSKDHTST